SSEEEQKPAPMNGFILDYALVCNNDFNKAKTIMGCYGPEHIPILSSLAKEFAISDTYFCSVPSQTWSNRRFLLSGTSKGEVHNYINPSQFLPVKKWDTIFDRME